MPDPTYGGQLKDFRYPTKSQKGESTLRMTKWSSLCRWKCCGTSETEPKDFDLVYGEMHPDVKMSARVAPPMIGLGLLEAIPDATLLQWADPEDRDGDGISGRVN